MIEHPFRVLSGGILLAAVLFLAFFIAGYAGKLPPLDWNGRTVSVLALSMLVYALAVFGVGFAWSQLLRAAGQPLAVGKAIVVVALTQFAKYVPGNIAQHIGRVALARDQGLAIAQVAPTVIVEAGLAHFAGFGFAGSMLAYDWTVGDAALVDASPWRAGMMAALAIALGLGLSVMLRRRLSVVARHVPPPTVLLVCLAFYIGNFLLAGSSIYILGAGLIGAGGFPLYAGVYAIAWIGGFLTPGPPAGLGVRDTILIAGLAPAIGAPEALLVTVAHRLVTGLSDAVVFLGALVVKPRFLAHGPPVPIGEGRRICMLTSTFPRWAGDSTAPFVLHLAQDLQALGYQVEILAPHAPGAASREILDGVHVTRFRYLWPERAQTVCYRGGALINLRQRRSNWLKLPALVLCEWWALVRLMARRPCDLVQAHWILPQGLVAVAAAALSGVPVVVTAHGSDVFGLRGSAMTWCKRIALRRAAAITVNSRATMEAVAEIAGGAEKICIVPMGAAIRATEGWEDVRRKYRRSQGPLLAFVGRLVEEKGVGDLIEAVALLAPELPDLIALIVGEGQDRAAFEELAARRSIESHIVFTGWVSPERIPIILAAADVFVGPSKIAPGGGVEGMGLVFAEAMLAGTPVVATRSGGIVDLVRHEQTGLLVSEAAPEEIAAAIKRLMADAELRERLIRDGRDFAVTNFTRERSAQSFSVLFAGLCDARPIARTR